MCLAASISLGQSGAPLYTADYYLAGPEEHVGQVVTLAVAYVKPRNEQREDGLRELDARTYNLNRWGGVISVLATPAAALQLINLCGTNVQHNGGGVRFTLIKGAFSQETSGNKRYYIAYGR